MVRLLAGCVALLLAPISVVSGEDMKPKFGDIGGVFYTEASYWKSVQEAGAYGRYLEIYPEGRFAASARHAASPEK